MSVSRSVLSAIVLLAALGALLLFAGLGSVGLTDRDEGANAGAAREMLELGSWLTPSLNYAPRFAKPALVYWLTVGTYAAIGVNETAARLPSALAAAATAGVQLAFARWALGASGGLRAALVLLLSIEFVALGRMALTDAVLVLWTTIAGYAFCRAHLGAPPRSRWYLLGFAALGLAMLTKGPVGVLVPVAGVVAFLALAGGWRRVGREAPLVTGALLFLAIAAPWYLAMFWVHGADYAARARGETLGRVLRTVTGPGGTALFYVPVVLVGFFPWSALLPGALVGTLRRARARAAADRRGAVAVFAAAWIVAGLVFFSLIQSRLPHYVAPLFPPAALLVAAAWPQSVPASTRWMLRGLGLLVGGALVVAGALGGTLTRLLGPAYPADPAARLAGSVYLVAVLALSVVVLASLRDGGTLFGALATATAALLVVGLHAVLPRFSADFVAPAQLLARRAAAEAATCDAIVAFGPYRPSLVFYARRPLIFVGPRDRERLADLAARPERLLVVTPRALRDALPRAIVDLPVAEERGGYVLLASPGPRGACA